MVHQRLKICSAHQTRNLNTSYVMVHLSDENDRGFILNYLNTSYVMVHPGDSMIVALQDIFKYILCYGSSDLIAAGKPPSQRFKYILCYGSSHRTAELNSTTKNLNTSYVMVHPYIIVSICCTYQNLNTSYVMVHRLARHTRLCRVTFKYILCYGSSQKRLFSIKTYNNLNTSYVMVHPFRTLS